MPARPPLTGRDTRELLQRHGLAPSRRYGQNFVVEPNVVRKVVRDAGVRAGDHVVEVGPGLGSLTLALREAGATVTAIEVDAGLVRVLTEVLDGDDGVEVVHADALKVDLGALATWPGLLVANLPYATATPIVLTALATGAYRRLFVMVQREVAERWTARVGHPLYSGVSVKVAAHADARIAATVARGAFRPAPNVESATVALDARAWTHEVERGAVLALVDAGFAQRRKRLRNTLPDVAWPSPPTPAAVESALERAGLEAGARPEELGLEAWVALAAALGAGGGSEGGSGGGSGASDEVA